MGFFSNLFRGRDAPSNSTAGSGYGFFMGSTASGKRVNARSAMQMTAVYSCVRILSEAVAGLPLQFYRYNDNGGKEKAVDHPLYFLLHDEPNPEMTSFVFRETLMTHLLLWGNAYSQIIRNGKGEIVALYPLMPDRMTVDRDEHGRLYYEYLVYDGDDVDGRTGTDPKANGKIVRLHPADVLHIPGLGFDGLVGYSPIAMAKNAIGLAIAAEEYGSKFYANGAAPSGVLEHPGTLKDPGRVRESWQSTFGGSSNANKVAVLEEGMKYTPISIAPNEAQFLETRKFQINEIARIFRVPPHMVGDLDKSSFSNIEQQSLEFVKYTLDPWVSRWEQAGMLKTEEIYMEQNNKRMPEAVEPLYFVIDEKLKSVDLTDKGVDLITGNSQDPTLFVLPDIAGQLSALENETGLSDEEKLAKKDELLTNFAIKSERVHTINQLLKAYTMFEKDTDYVVMDGQVKIVDEQTGRIMDGRRWSDGLHQAVEAKEGVKIEAATQTFATITLQNYFRMYHKLSGMTGTAETEAGEFWDIYKLDVVVIPTNRPIARIDMNDRVYKTKREKYKAVIEEIEKMVQAGRPVLVGTTSVEISEMLSKMLTLRKIQHNVLNAKLHQKEADIVAKAGQSSTVTIATNMAGRGTNRFCFTEEFCKSPKVFTEDSSSIEYFSKLLFTLLATSSIGILPFSPQFKL